MLIEVYDVCMLCEGISSVKKQEGLRAANSVFKLKVELRPFLGEPQQHQIHEKQL